MSDVNAASVAAAAAAQAASAAAAATPWFQGKVDADIIGHWQNHGYDVNDPVKVSVELTKAHREAEKLIGAPSAQIIRLPVDPSKDPDGMKAVFQRLGMPLDAKDYEFPALKDKDGKIADTRLEAALRTAATDAMLPKAAAERVAAAVVKHQADVATAAAADTAAKAVTSVAELAKNWGTTPDKLDVSPNMLVARNAALALKVPKEAIEALQGQVGYAAVMEMFRSLGSRMGEDTFIRAPGGGGSEKIASVSQAKARYTELKADKAWSERLMAGDTAAKREFESLMTIISTGDEDRI